MSARKGGKPWNWRGLPVIEPRGYVLIFVGKGHPLADCRGYAYEHRIKAQEALGRALIGKEEVHHDDRATSNNDPSNLVVCAGRAEHGVYHRKPRSNKQLPGEDNPVLECACGCGATFLKYDRWKRPRLFVAGHNTTHDENGRWTPL